MTNNIHHCNETCPDLPIIECSWCHVPLGHAERQPEGVLCKECAFEVNDHDYWWETQVH